MNYLHAFCIPASFQYQSLEHSAILLICIKGIYFVIYGIISEFTDKGQFQYLTNLKGPQERT